MAHQQAFVSGIVQTEVAIVYEDASIDSTFSPLMRSLFLVGILLAVMKLRYCSLESGIYVFTYGINGVCC